MTSPTRPAHPVVGTALYVLAALGGFVLAVIVVLNLHILVGLEQGYAATPAEVVDLSPVLAVVDVLLLVGGPVGGAMAVRAVQRRR